MRLISMRRWVLALVLGLGITSAGAAMLHSRAVAQDNSKDLKTELSRKPKTKVAPIYPDMARRMGISGTVRLTVTVAPNGAVKSSKAIGGHPVLVKAALDAMKQWRFEAASTESSGIVEFKFEPRD